MRTSRSASVKVCGIADKTGIMVAPESIVRTRPLTSSDNWNLNIQRRYILERTDKCTCSYDIKSSNTKDFSRIINTMKFEDFANNRDSGVDRIRNDANKGFRTVFSTTNSKSSYDSCIDFEEIISYQLETNPYLVIPGLRGTPAGITTM
jgi:hypothetical protein